MENNRSSWPINTNTFHSIYFLSTLCINLLVQVLTKNGFLKKGRKLSCLGWVFIAPAENSQDKGPWKWFLCLFGMVPQHAIHLQNTGFWRAYKSEIVSIGLETQKYQCFEFDAAVGSQCNFFFFFKLTTTFFLIEIKIKILCMGNKNNSHI